MATHDRIDYQNDRIFKYTNVKILSGQTESEAIDCRGGVMVRFLAPAGMTGTSFTFKVSDDNVTFTEYCNTAGNVVTSAVNAGKSTGIVDYDFKGTQWIKFVSSSAEAAERNLEVLFRGE